MFRHFNRVKKLLWRRVGRELFSNQNPGDFIPGIVKVHRLYRDSSRDATIVPKETRSNFDDHPQQSTPLTFQNLELGDRYLSNGGGRE